jgi:hypothetical protein
MDDATTEYLFRGPGRFDSHLVVPVLPLRG